MDPAKEDELRNKYMLIGRGLLSLRNAVEALVRFKATGDPFFDDNEEARQKLLSVLKKASERANRNEISALVAEYGPDARRVLD